MPINACVCTLGLNLPLYTRCYIIFVDALRSHHLNFAQWDTTETLEGRNQYTPAGIRFPMHPRRRLTLQSSEIRRPVVPGCSERIPQTNDTQQHYQSFIGGARYKNEVRVSTSLIDFATLIPYQ
jgi:hypothetical protein